jgi:preprotein translocase subunit SecB
MKLSPLQLKHYHFTHLNIISKPDFDMDSANLSDSPYPEIASESLQTAVKLGEPQDELDPHQFVVMLEISLDTAAQNFPYTFNARLEGVFHINHNGDLDERKSLVVCNGASMLYGAAREILLMTTARHKYGAVLLPSANFNGMRPNNGQSKVAGSKSRTKKIKDESSK